MPQVKNGQGTDMDSQYRSMIEYHTPEQELAAKKSKEDLESIENLNGRRIVIEIVPASTFYKAIKTENKKCNRIPKMAHCSIKEIISNAVCVMQVSKTIRSKN
jgi:peptide methionine sulfoxide reductase MsrA